MTQIFNKVWFVSSSWNINVTRVVEKLLNLGEVCSEIGTCFCTCTYVTFVFIIIHANAWITVIKNNICKHISYTSVYYKCKLQWNHKTCLMIH